MNTLLEGGLCLTAHALPGDPNTSVTYHYQILSERDFGKHPSLGKATQLGVEV